jgi:hypothetical protein
MTPLALRERITLVLFVVLALGAVGACVVTLSSVLDDPCGVCR